jgi:hypothetical protein
MRKELCARRRKSRKLNIMYCNTVLTVLLERNAITKSEVKEKNRVENIKQRKTDAIK